MGILNVTPDSFYDGGRFQDLDRAVERGLALVEEGADILDVGGESTRPRGHTYGTGARMVPVAQEIERVIPVIEALKKSTSVPISVDTWKAPVARAALHAGAVMVNDISGLHFDPDLPSVVAAAGASVVLMHTPAPPWEMPERPQYADLLTDIKTYLREGIRVAVTAGIGQLFIDPGLGFGKSQEENFRLLANLQVFRELGYPLLIGASRKSFIGSALSLGPEERLEGSLAALVAAVLHGASVVRVHDVMATRRAVAVADAVVHAGWGGIAT